MRTNRESVWKAKRDGTPVQLCFAQRNYIVNVMVSPMASKTRIKTKITPRKTRNKAKTIFHLRLIPRFGVIWLSAGGMGGGLFSFIKRSVVWLGTGFFG